MNETSNFSRLILEITEEEAIDCRSLSGGWVFYLSKNGRTGLIFGYQFGLNSDTAQAVCSDKCTASECLALNGIPHVEHRYFMNPDKLRFADPRGNWSGLLEMLEKHHRLVIKDNTGTGGDGVYLAEDSLTLENAVHRLFSHCYAIAASPYLAYEKEYRAIVLNGSVKIIYTKKRPSLIGNGVSSIKELYAAHLLENVQPFQALLPFGELNRIPAKGECCPLIWKHNLGHGARAEIVTEPAEAKPVASLALRAAKALGAGFVSVDIIFYQGSYLVMEVNDGVMMENFCAQNEEYRSIAKDIYREAILFMLSSCPRLS